ncbi:hypothetical protein LJC33_09190 [Eubacteriales bacterium OttesenSCG-928-N13]|nr:hypothetical protein [Eubacteriales bacterium OttesenSCG-928-N13]
MKRIISLTIALLLAMPACALAEHAPYAILNALYQEYGQLVYSPTSLELAASMAAQGAAGETRQQLLDVIGLTEPRSDDLAQYEQLKSANAALVHRSVQLLDSYLALLEQDYQAEVFPMADDVVSQVNAWASEKTDGMIDELLTEPPSDNLRLMLLNALLLDAEWDMVFDSNETHEDTFHAPGGDATVQMMHKTYPQFYAQAQGAQAVKLPYEGEELEMLVILPAAGEMQKALNLMSEQGLDWLGEFAEPDQLSLSLPKAKLESSMDLAPLLMARGASLPFGMDADFSGMTGDAQLYISGIVQKVRLDVDEEGTKAAAVTGFELDAKSAFLETDPVEMIVNRPYIMLVQTVDGQHTLFAAVVENPAQP